MKNVKRKILTIIFIIWLIVIFIFSSMSGNESNGKSKKTINKALTEAATITNDLNITDVNTQSTKKIKIIEKLNAPLRKCMHASVYFVLSIIISFVLKMYKINNKKAFILAIVISFLYACTDEFHQIFVAGRTGCFSDVLIDTCGAFLGTTFFYILVKLKKKIC